MHITRRQFLYSSTAAAAALAFAPGAFARGGLEENLAAALKAPVDRGEVAGLVGAITSAEETIYSGAFGERKLGSGVAMTEDT
ncbi:MAG TPA: twin-arginine translocation signal domain-containing protein, partial [Amaricoccus sp.]|nr:twin-arginine translocation signal domain-containing protein [Amaricoccus sp.]